MKSMLKKLQKKDGIGNAFGNSVEYEECLDPDDSFFSEGEAGEVCVVDGFGALVVVVELEEVESGLVDEDGVVGEDDGAEDVASFLEGVGHGEYAGA